MEIEDPACLLSIMRQEDSSPVIFDSILFGRAEKMKKSLTIELSICENQNLVDSIVENLQGIPESHRMRLYVSSELGEWLSNMNGTREGEPTARPANHDELLDMIQREVLVHQVLEKHKVSVNPASTEDSPLWSPLGDFSVKQKDGNWALQERFMVGEVSAIDFDSPLARRYEARSGTLSMPRLEWTEAEKRLVCAKLNMAMNAIDVLTPEYGALIRNFTRRIIVRKSDETGPGCDESDFKIGSEHVPRQPGSIRILNPHLQKYKIANCMETLLHESIHNLLAAWEMMNHRFVSKSQAVRPISPWSGNPIPNSSFVHAVFVYYACHRLFERYLGTGEEYSEGDLDYVRRRLAIFVVGFIGSPRLGGQLLLNNDVNPNLIEALSQMQKDICQQYAQYHTATISFQ